MGAVWIYLDPNTSASKWGMNDSVETNTHTHTYRPTQWKCLFKVYGQSLVVLLCIASIQYIRYDPLWTEENHTEKTKGRKEMEYENAAKPNQTRLNRTEPTMAN